jgi:hypothetical protein
MPPERAAWSRVAVLRPGQEVRLLNISPQGALVESAARLRPGLRAELHLTQGASRVAVRGRLERCEVVRLEPLVYRGAILFEECLALPAAGRVDG